MRGPPGVVRKVQGPRLGGVGYVGVRTCDRVRGRARAVDRRKHTSAILGALPTVAGFPCNQFGGQEPGSDEAINTFACSRFKVSFPMFAKVDVNGDKAHPLYKYLTSTRPGIFGESIKWNFQVRVQCTCPPLRTGLLNVRTLLTMPTHVPRACCARLRIVQKFLIDRKGTIVERYASTTKPTSMSKDVEKLL
ncbi:glutathione peroxidase [archaeon]|nr:MAG: glutathione peroxidase [archaeon]